MTVEVVSHLFDHEEAFFMPVDGNPLVEALGEMNYKETGDVQRVTLEQLSKVFEGQTMVLNDDQRHYLYDVLNPVIDRAIEKANGWWGHKENGPEEVMVVNQCLESIRSKCRHALDATNATQTLH